MKEIANFKNELLEKFPKIELSDILNLMNREGGLAGWLKGAFNRNENEVNGGVGEGAK